MVQNAGVGSGCVMTVASIEHALTMISAVRTVAILAQYASFIPIVLQGNVMNHITV